MHVPESPASFCRLAQANMQHWQPMQRSVSTTDSFINKSFSSNPIQHDISFGWKMEYGT
jgi:hypothetical protein